MAVINNSSDASIPSVSLTAEQILAELIGRGGHSAMGTTHKAMMLEVLNEILSFGVIVDKMSDKKADYRNVYRG